jgi:hypothetical protein
MRNPLKSLWPLGIGEFDRVSSGSEFACKSPADIPGAKDADFHSFGAKRCDRDLIVVMYVAHSFSSFIPNVLRHEMAILSSQ